MFLFSLFISQCFHEEFQEKLDLYGTPIYETAEKESTRQKIRINFDISPFISNTDSKMCVKQDDNIAYFISSKNITCKDEDLVINEKKKLLENKIEDVKNYVEDLVSLNRLKNPINIEPFKDFADFQLNETTVNADLYVVVGIRPFPDDYETNSGSVYHPLSLVSGRPTVGAIFINPRFLNKATEKSLFDELLHQMFHILGLSKQIFNTSLITTIEDEKMNYRIVKGNYSQAFARNRFNADSFFVSKPGVELHRDSFHTSSRVYYSDIMNEEDFGHRVLSEATLSLLADTGFYKIDFSKKEQLIWGHGLGSDFALKAPQEVFPANYLCADDDDDNLCSYDYKGKAKCVKRVDAYDCSTEEGKQTEYCKHVSFYNPKGHKKITNVADYQSVKEYYPYLCNSAMSKTNLSKEHGESFEENSYCAIGKDRNGHQFSGCYPISCNSIGMMSITVGSRVIICHEDGQNVKLPDGNGYVKCPPKQSICPYAQVDDSHSKLVIVLETSVLFLVILMAGLITFCGYCCSIKEIIQKDEKTVDIPLIV